MKFTQTTYTNPVSILKFADHFVGIPYMVADDGVSANADGKKIVPAGTILPANDATAIGVLLHDVDVTNGDAPGTLVIHGFIDATKLPADPTEGTAAEYTEAEYTEAVYTPAAGETPASYTPATYTPATYTPATLGAKDVLKQITFVD